MTNLDIFLDRIDPDGLIVGTNNADDVPLGSKFTRLTKIHVDRSSGASMESWSTRIDLRLVGAVIFRKSVEIVPHGWSAGFRLEGAGIEAIAEALDGKGEAEFIHLQAARMQPND